MTSTTPTASLARTPLHDWHQTHHGKLVDFAGWSMPVQYGSIVAEHNAVRTAAGLFDVSHMGRLRFTGPGAGPFLERLITRKVADLPLGRIRYGLVTNDAGGILDDILVYRLAEAGGGESHLLVVNASNREKIVNWIQSHSDGSFGFQDLTTETAMIAVQGPRALEFVQPLVSVGLARMKYYSGVPDTIGGHAGIVSRTGYTGEDGCELILPVSGAVAVWEAILQTGGGAAVPAGLGARDTLRLEAAMPLYGHELSEQLNPFQAGLEFAVNLEGRTFPGRDALARLREQPPSVVRVGLQLESRRVPREHFPVLTPTGERIGEVSSGTFSPTFQKPIAMAYVRREHATLGTSLAIDIRGAAEPAQVVPLPFYKRTTS